MVLMSLLTVTLIVLLPRQVALNKVLNRSRWLMAGGTALMAIQFLLQYFLRLRELGVTQSVMVNLLFFIPCASLFSLAISNLQRQGNVPRPTWVIGLSTWIVTVVLLFGAFLLSGQPILSDTAAMRTGEYLSAVFYAIMQIYITVVLYQGNKRLTRALENYYDHDTHHLLQWVRRSIFMLAIVAVGAPFLIFSTGLHLLIYALTIFFSIYYLVVCFMLYCVSNDALQVSEASEIAEETELVEEAKVTVSEEDFMQVEAAVKNWLKRGRYLQSGITMKVAMNEMHLSRYQLAAWLKTTEWELFNPWLAHLRIEEAKRMLLKHPEWSNDAVAQHCGFSSRSYFQQIFKKQTGMTPAQYVRTGVIPQDER